MQNIIKQQVLSGQKDLMEDYSSAINMRRQMANVEREIEVKQAQNLEATARQSLYNETNKRKEILEKFKDDFKSDYEQR